MKKKDVSTGKQVGRKVTYTAKNISIILIDGWDSTDNADRFI